MTFPETEGYRHEESTDSENMARCSGLACVDVQLKYGPCPYTVRCDDETHPHREIVCIDPSGYRRLYDIRHRHDHPPGKGAPFLGLTKLWPKSEFERVRVPELQTKYGRPLPPRPPEPPPIEQPPGFMQVASGIHTGRTSLQDIAARAMRDQGLQHPPDAPAAPPAAERPPLRTWTGPEAEMPPAADVDDGWQDSDIPF